MSPSPFRPSDDGGTSLSLLSLGVVTIVAVALPHVVGIYYTDLATRIVIWALFAVAFNLSFGFAGLPSFGHAAFFGLGAYGVGITLLLAPGTILLPIAGGVFLAASCGALVAVFATRGRGIYFALITFAFAQFVFELFFRIIGVTGRSDGMLMSFPDPAASLLGNEAAVFYLSILLLVATLGVLRRMVQSPFGAVMAAIRYNEDRAGALGYAVKRVKIVAFVISSTLSGVAGVIFALRFQLVHPGLLRFEVSFEVLVMAIVGGSSYVAGPALGAVVVVLIEEVAWGSSAIASIIQGVFFIGVVMFSPAGLSPLLRRGVRSVRSRFE